VYKHIVDNNDIFREIWELETFETAKVNFRVYKVIDTSGVR